MIRIIPIILLGIGVLGYFAWNLNPAGDVIAIQLDHDRPQPQGDMWRSALPEPATCNPFNSYGSIPEQMVLKYTHQALYDIDPDTGSIRPALAESVVLEADGVTLTVTLREKLEFSNGAAVTVDDAHFVFRVLQNPDCPGSAMGDKLSDVESFKVIDPRRFSVRLSAPHRSNLALFATSFRILSRDYFTTEVRKIAKRRGMSVQPGPDDEVFGQLLDDVLLPGPATGPYTLASWTPGVDLTLAQNPNCWQRGARPKSWNLAGMRIRFQSDPTGQFASLRKQKIDWMVASNDLDKLLANDAALRDSYHVEVYDKRSRGQYLIYWNHEHPALRKLEVRRALSMLFDRETLIAKLFGGHAVASNCFFKPNTPPHSDLPAPKFDPKAAQALLTAAGYDQDNPLELEVLTGGNPILQQIMDFAAPAFEIAGIRLHTTMTDQGSKWDRVTNKTYMGIVILQNYTIHMDPRSMFGAENDLGYDNEQVQDLISQADLELNDARRNDLYHKFNQIIAEDQPVTMLVFERNRIVLHNRYKGVEVGVEGLIPENWWVESADQIVKSR